MKINFFVKILKLNVDNFIFQERNKFINVQIKEDMKL